MLSDRACDRTRCTEYRHSPEGDRERVGLVVIVRNGLAGLGGGPGDLNTWPGVSLHRENKERQLTSDTPADGSLRGLGWWVQHPPLCATTFAYAATPTSDTHFHAITTPPFPSPISSTHACSGLAGLAGLAVGHGRLQRFVSTGPGRFSSGGLGCFQSP